MEKVNTEQLKKEMVFHLYGRFAPIQQIIEKNREIGKTFRILDVGGRGNQMKRFFPNDEVFYLDPFLDSGDKNFIKGDGCAMPLESGSFDWVVSTDVFEHIPVEKRDAFLNENLRVAELGVVLVAPFYSSEVAQAEINANENFKILSGGTDHVWLKEHIKNGLPMMEEPESVLQEKKLEFQKLFNNRLFLWQTLLGIEFLTEFSQHNELKNDFEDFNNFYNSEVYPFDNQEPSYRKVYFIKKVSNLNNIEVKIKSLDDKLYLETIKRAINLVAKKYASNRNFTFLKNSQDEIELMKSSKFWRLREKYLISS